MPRIWIHKNSMLETRIVTPNKLRGDKGEASQRYLSFRVQVSEIDGPDPGSGPDVKDATDFGVRFARRGEAEFAIESVDEDLVLLVCSLQRG